MKTYRQHRRIRLGLGLAVWGIALATFLTPTPKAQEAVRSLAADVLLLHGINPTTQGVLQYLQTGFSQAILTSGLPNQPRDKTQIVVFGVQVLGDLQARESVDLLMKMCEGQLPGGVQQAFRIDMQGIDALLAKRERDRLEEFVVFNTMVALGWIGDPKAIPTVRKLMETRTPTGYITQGALAIAMMGDTGGLPKVIDLLEKGNPAERAGAARIFYYITGRFYNLTPQSSIARQKAVIDDVKQWFVLSGQNLSIPRAEIIRRRQDPYPPNPIAPDTSSIRGLCQASAMIVEDYAISFAARRQLAALTQDALPELEEVARDQMEDNDVRLEALRHYVRIAGKDAKSLLKVLDGDENAAVAERAKYIRKNLDEVLKTQGVQP